MWKQFQVVAVVLMAGFLLAIVLENVAHYYGLGPHGDTTSDVMGGPDSAPPSAPPSDPRSGPSPSAGRPVGNGPEPPSHAQSMRVTFVWDGDTIQLQADEAGEIVTSLAKVPVRLIGVDTPEVESQLRDEPSECYGEEATDFLRDLIPNGTQVVVDRDRTGWDDFDRRLLYVWRAEDGLFINYELVAQGYGEAIRVWPNVAYWDEFDAAQKRAKHQGQGMWGAC
jgi:micrococcal nuclease